VLHGPEFIVHLNALTSYFEVEMRLVPVKASKGFIMDPHDAIPFVDKNTIGIIVIIGSTYTGHFENVQLMNNLCTHTLSRLLPSHTNYLSID
jgi:glutamate decarboxylase